MLKSLLREPLVRFVLLAGVLFAAEAVFGTDNREVISVDAATQDYLLQRQAELAASDVNALDQVSVVEGFIEEEILVREARRLGLDDSSPIRSMLLRNMRLFLTSDLPEPTEAELRDFFRENAEAYMSDPATTFEHVQFSDPEMAPADAIDRLNSSVTIPSMGDTGVRTSGALKMADATVLARFGEVQGKAILESELNQWAGPFPSTDGAHFFRIVQRHPRTLPPFEHARVWLEQEWSLRRSRETVEREVARLRQEYRIDIAPPESAAQ